MVMPSIDFSVDASCTMLLAACAILTTWRAAALVRDDLRDRLLVGPCLTERDTNALEALLLAEAGAGILHSSGTVDLVDVVDKLRNSHANLCSSRIGVEFIQR